MTNFDALKQIYEALGGEEEISGTNLDALKAIAEVATGGGGGGTLIVGATYDEEEGKLTLNKTWAEIDTAINAGMTCKLFADWVANGGTATCHVRSLIVAATSSLYDDPEDPQSSSRAYYVVFTNQTGQVTPTYAVESENEYPWLNA